MNKQKYIATFWLALLFGSGLIIGMIAGPTTANGESKRRGILPEQRWIEQHRSRLINELDLTAEQLRLIEPVYAKSSGRLRKIRETMAGDIRQVVRENRRGLMEILTDKQIEHFKSLHSAKSDNSN